METTDEKNTAYAPRKLSLSENVMLTIKILAIAGLILAALWGISEWASPS
jgi:hypothetical protein